jgi:prepilin-type processing-associated H-X9-DG protein
MPIRSVFVLRDTRDDRARERNPRSGALGRRREAAMSDRVLDVPWERVRPEVTILRADGRFERAIDVERHPNRVIVLFSDGRREQHAPSDRAGVLVHHA